MSKPCSQLNSKLIRDTAECHVLSLVSRQCSVVAFKCLWRVDDSKIHDAWKWICEKREECDSKLYNINEIAFFFSAISTSKVAPKRNEDQEMHEETVVSASQVVSKSSNHKIFPAITYWAACQTPNGAPVNPLILQRALVKCGVEVYMSKSSAKKGCQHINQLCQALKDHKNPCMMDLVATSFQHCLRNLKDQLNLSGDTYSRSAGTENVVKLQVKEPRMKSRLTTAAKQLKSSGLLVDCYGLEDNESSTLSANDNDEPVNRPLSSPVTVLCFDIKLAMEKLNFGVHRGDVFKKDPRSNFTYTYLCTMKTFLSTLMGNDAFKDRLVQYHTRVLPILSDEDNYLIPQLEIMKDLVEVQDGWFWCFTRRRFIKNAIKDTEIGVKTPRAYFAYDSKKEPDPKYFAEILQNSLKEDEIRQFCIDYTALFQPKKHKDPVPCLIGASDSGKTSLFTPVFQVIPLQRIARVTKQKAFNKSMIDQATDVIFLDEAYPELLDVDDWKLLCQGGYTSHDTKWKKAKGFQSKATMFITCQEELDFGDVHNPAMNRRLHKYFFQSLPDVKPEASQWLKDHAMDCIVWATRQIDEPQSQEIHVSNEHQIQTEGLSCQDILDITTLQLIDDCNEDDVTNERDTSSSSEDESMISQSQEEESDTEDDIVEIDIQMDLRILEENLQSCDVNCLRGRLLRILYETAKEMKENCKSDFKRCRKRQLAFRRKQLVEYGVVDEEVAAKCITDPDKPLPPVLQKRYELALKKRKEQQQEEHNEEEEEKAKEVYKNKWLVKKEEEMAELVREYLTTKDEKRLAALQALMEITGDKIRMFHKSQGTLGSIAAIKERRKLLVSMGLIKERNAHFVIDVDSPLPCFNEKEEDDEEQEMKEKEENQDEDLTPPPTPSYKLKVKEEDDEDQKMEEKEENRDKDLKPPRTPSYKLKRSMICSPPTPRRLLTQRPSKRRRQETTSDVKQRDIKYFFSQQ